MRTRQSGWNSPSVIIGALSLVASAGWAYVAVSRADTKATQDKIDDTARRLDRLETTIATRTPMSDQQMADFNSRLRRLEDRRR